LSVAQPISITGTAHACGTLVCGSDPGASVVDAHGRVHGMENLYVADGSVLPRVSRVNPALTIYAWGLRLASHLGGLQAEAGRRATGSEPEGHSNPSGPRPRPALAGHAL
jgi:choline dehydrogenase-like flavoprotein